MIDVLTSRTDITEMVANDKFNNVAKAVPMLYLTFKPAQNGLKCSYNVASAVSYLKNSSKWPLTV